MAWQYIIAGFPFPLYVNETGTRQEILPGAYLNEITTTGIGWELNTDQHIAIQHQHRPLSATQSEDPIWSFTATPTPEQFGWNNPEQFAKRLQPRRISQSDEDPEWPFTAVLTPAQFGWYNSEAFAKRSKPRRLSISDEDAIWKFTSITTPIQMGWEMHTPVFPQRRQHVNLTLHHGEDGEAFVVSTPAPGGPAAYFDTPFIANIGRLMNRH